MIALHPTVQDRLAEEMQGIFGKSIDRSGCPG